MKKAKMVSSLNNVWRCASILLLLLSALSSAQENATTSPAPSPAPSAPSSDNNSTTVSPAPTVVVPGNDTVAPTEAPTGNATTMSPAPTLAPTSNVTTESPTMAPVPNTTDGPTLAPSQTSPATPAPSKKYFPPSSAPSEEQPIPPPPKKHHGASIWRIIGKTIALLILMGLSLLLFGAIMSNRYRIYYYIRSAWYSFLRWEGTRYVIRKLRLERFFGGQDTSLNGIIFDNDMTEGLLMQDT